LMEWRNISKIGCTFDQNSLSIDPNLLNSSGLLDRDTDFKLRNDSIAINSGIDVGLSHDRAGVAIPQGFMPDIGAFEYIATTNPLGISVSASTISGYVPLTVSFTGGVAGGTPPYSYSWDFGDGGSSNQQNPAHTFATATNFTVTLTVTDSVSSSATDSITIAVSSPIHEATIPTTPNGPSNGASNVSYMFATGGATCTMGHTVEYRFDWGDGSISNWAAPQSVVHAWATPGVYVLKAQSRCVVDSTIISVWSQGKTLVISNVSTFALDLSMATSASVPGDGGSISPSSGTYSYPLGSSISLTANPNIDYRFSKWTGDVTDNQAYDKDITISMDRNRALTAHFFTKCGDVNGDLTLSPADSQEAFDIFLGKVSNPSISQMENADVNCDGTSILPMVTPMDAHAIFKKYLGTSELPGDCSCSSRTNEAPSSVSQIKYTMRSILQIEDIEAEPGETIFVPIQLDTPMSITSFGFDVIYPTDILRFEGVSKTELTKDFDQLGSNEISDGRVRIGGFRIDSLQNSSSGAFFMLVFKIRENASGTSLLIITNSVDDLENAYSEQGNIYVSEQKNNLFSKRPHFIKNDIIKNNQ
ncbi:PKD domain-containing protein, partial [Acidobacteriota bacterium]